MLNHRSFFTTSFKLLKYGLFLTFLFGCTNMGGGSSSSSSTKSACAGDGGLFPTPIAPQAMKAHTKFAFTSKANSYVESGTKLVAVINEKCVAAQPMGANHISQNLRTQMETLGSHLPERAYSYTAPYRISKNELRVQVEKDPCLLSLSEDHFAYRTATTVNDPLYSSQFHLPAINASEAWDTFYDGLTGDVVIAVIDDGMQMNHPDLSGALWVNSDEIASNGVDDDGNGYIDDVNGYNFTSTLPSPAHENGATHGTHVTGLAAAKDNNSIGITGVMGRNIKIMTLNVFGPNAGSSAAAIVNAINYARNNGADVINMSLGGSGTAPSVNVALQNAVAGGAFVAIAAGNDNIQVTSSNFVYPMGYAKDIEGAMAVGSLDAKTLEKSDFSNYSTTYVEIAAPGSDDDTGGVYSTYPTSTYSYLQGTSMASPVLAGAAALVIGYVRSQGSTITPAQVESLLKSSADARAGLSPYFLGGASLDLKNLADAAVCNL